DARWSALVASLYALAERELANYRGIEVDRAGDGLLATFDGPTRAIRCARALQAGVEELGLELRAGVHTGEVERVGTGVRGIAVHTAARVAALAGPSEILVTATVRDLVAGAGFRFEDCGRHELKGVEGQRQLFRVSNSSSPLRPLVLGANASDLAQLSDPAVEPSEAWARRPHQL